MLIWWQWIVVGIILCLAELLTPGIFFFLFLGISAIVVGIFSLFLPYFWLQLLMFSFLSIVLFVFLRKPLVKKLKEATPKADSFNSFMLGEAKVLQEIPVGGEGQVEFQGSFWKARNVGNCPLNAGEICVVQKREGLELLVVSKTVAC